MSKLADPLGLHFTWAVATRSGGKVTLDMCRDEADAIAEAAARTAGGYLSVAYRLMHPDGCRYCDRCDGKTCHCENDE